MSGPCNGSLISSSISSCNGSLISSSCAASIDICTGSDAAHDGAAALPAAAHDGAMGAATAPVPVGAAAGVGGVTEEEVDEAGVGVAEEARKEEAEEDVEVAVVLDAALMRSIEETEAASSPPLPALAPGERGPLLAVGGGRLCRSDPWLRVAGRASR